jgi:anti-anti-sigma regulatory factor
MGVSPIADSPPPTTGAGARDFWAVYDAHYEEVTGRLNALITADPELARAVSQGVCPTGDSERRRSHELAGEAILRGCWEPYEALIREQGAAYGRAGLPFGVWSRALGALRAELMPLLVDAYASDPARLAAAMHAKSDFVDRVMTVLGEEYLRVKEEVILNQAAAIRELSTPVLRMRPGLLLLPIVGVIDTHRARQLTESLLQAIHHDRARVAVLDITGVPAVDSRVAQHLMQTVGAARLMGTEAIITGLAPDVALSLVSLGLDLGQLRTVGDLQGGVEAAERLLAARSEGRPA